MKNEKIGIKGNFKILSREGKILFEKDNTILGDGKAFIINALGSPSSGTRSSLYTGANTDLKIFIYDDALTPSVVYELLQGGYDDNIEHDDKSKGLTISASADPTNGIIKYESNEFFITDEPGNFNSPSSAADKNYALVNAEDSNNNGVIKIKTVSLGYLSGSDIVKLTEITNSTVEIFNKDLYVKFVYTLSL